MYCIASHHRLMCEEPKEGNKVLQATNRGKAVKAWDPSFENDTEYYADNEFMYSKASLPLVH